MILDQFLKTIFPRKAMFKNGHHPYLSMQSDYGSLIHSGILQIEARIAG